MPKCVVTLTVDDGSELVEFTKMLNLAAIPRVGEQLWIVADEEEIECFEVSQIMHPNHHDWRCKRSQAADQAQMGGTNVQDEN